MSTKAYNDKRKKIKARRVQHLHRLKVKLGCQLCGYNEHGAALVFDHIDPSTKSHYCVGQGKGGSGMNGLTKRICLPGSRPDSSKKNRQNIKDLFNEIRKCRILCANCHSIETFKSKQPWEWKKIYEERKAA
tara:strand:- start:64 stop:459 length:396 start_codon:yes stop_codon:yes gene_type:complete